MISSVQGLQSAKAVSFRKAAAPVRTCVVRAAGSGFDQDWLNKTPLVPVVGFLGWTVPSNIPVPALGGSLFGKFTESMGAELAHFPQGPGFSDTFWLYMITWHVGLFTTIFLGQIGVNGRKQGYW